LLFVINLLFVFGYATQVIAGVIKRVLLNGWARKLLVAFDRELINFRKRVACLRIFWQRISHHSFWPTHVLALELAFWPGFQKLPTIEGARITCISIPLSQGHNALARNSSDSFQCVELLGCKIYDTFV